MVVLESNSLKFISQIGNDLIEMACREEGLNDWLERHNHIRLFADTLYGDSEEAMMLSCAMILAADKTGCLRS